MRAFKLETRIYMVNSTSWELIKLKVNDRSFWEYTFVHTNCEEYGWTKAGDVCYVDVSATVNITGFMLQFSFHVESGASTCWGYTDVIFKPDYCNFFYTFLVNFYIIE